MLMLYILIYFTHIIKLSINIFTMYQCIHNYIQQQLQNCGQVSMSSKTE